MPHDLKLDSNLIARVQRFAETHHQSSDSVVRTAIEQFLEREENPSEKKYPQRSPVGGIITPV